MERFAFELSQCLAEITPLKLIVNKRGKRALPFFLPYAAAAGLMATRSGASHVHLADASLAPLGSIYRRAGATVSITVHGLDLTYRNPAYQAMLRRTLPDANGIIAVSRPTARLASERWPELAGRVLVIPNGVRPPGSEGADEVAPGALAGRRVILTVGRLIARKGVAWFVGRVLPNLPSDVLYVVAGEGPEASQIRAAAASAGVQDRVLLLGKIPDSSLEGIYRAANIFVMPNVSIPGDVEGFGLVAVEASVRGLPVVAANLQGIPEAIHDGHNGILVASEDAGAFESAIKRLLAMTPAERASMGRQSRDYTLDVFSWAKCARLYLHQFEDLRHSRLRGAVVAPEQEAA
jgi:glycosyltransferase involved in cell wall biosynthesis